MKGDKAEESAAAAASAGADGAPPFSADGVESSLAEPMKALNSFLSAKTWRECAPFRVAVRESSPGDGSLLPEGRGWTSSRDFADVYDEFTDRQP